MCQLRNYFGLFFCSLLLLTNCQSQSEPKAHLDSNKTVLEYCKSFALKYSETYSYIYTKESVSIKRKGLLERTLNKLSDAVSPKGSSFTDGYDCLFQVEDSSGEFYNISVGLFLAETYEFAQYTIGQTETGRIIPIEYVISKDSQKTGYGVFKFLKKQKPESL